MDPKFIEWLGQTLIGCARQTQALSDLTRLFTGGGTADKAAWPAGLILPFAPEVMNDLYREWLKVMGAVPKSDYDALSAKVQTLEMECRQLKAALLLIKPAIGDLTGPTAIETAAELGLNLTKDWLNFFEQLMSGSGAKAEDGQQPTEETSKK
ncbi:MAG: hypothetical protein AB1641_11955 [Thermodesulfobacteriota bacterium]